MAITPIHFNQSSLKTLTSVEAETKHSNQHEFQGVSTLRKIFGIQRTEHIASFSIRGENAVYQSKITWYDSRKNNPSRSPEYRLYFQSNPVMDIAKSGDNILIGVDEKDNIHCELIPNISTDYRYTPDWD